MFRCHFKLDVQIHYVENQVELTEVDLELENCVSLARHFDEELIL
jgi:hypothetical protein